MKRNYLYIVIAFLISALNTYADVSFTIQPPRDVVAGQPFRVVYRLVNAQGNALNVTPIQGCTLRYGPSTSTSQSMTIINGQTNSTTTVDYTYMYIADKEGEYTIPAATIQVNGKTLTADAKRFKVLPADKQSGNGSQNGSVSVTDRDSQYADRTIGKDDIFVRVILNKSSAYKDEAVECILKLYTKYEAIESFSASSTPTYEGFIVEDVPVKAELNALENYNGQNYRTAILRKYILYPQKSGSLSVTSGSYEIVVQQLERYNQGYFTYTRPIRKQVNLKESVVKLNVKDLPSPAPAGFEGAVGSFSMTAEMQDANIKTGEAGTLTYTISGTGNIKFLKDPVAPLPSEFEVYAPTRDENVRVAGDNMTGSVKYIYTFVPQYPGKFDIAGYDFVYFDPKTSQYKTISAPGFNMDIAKGSGSVVSNGVDAPGLKSKNTDIRHIHTGDYNFSSSHNYMIDSPLYWSVFVILTLALVVVYVMMKRQRKNRSDANKMRVSRANKVARRRLKEAHNLLDSDSLKFYDALLKALWGYFGDKLNLSGADLTRGNIVSNMTASGAPEVLSNRVVKLIDNCEMARYTPDSPELAPRELYREANDIINEFESQKFK